MPIRLSPGVSTARTAWPGWGIGSTWPKTTASNACVSSSADGILDVKELVTDNIPGGGGHFTRTVHFGPDGKMYVSAGSSCNVCAETDPRRAAILRFNPDGSIPPDNPYANDGDVRKRAVWASGLRNSVDFLWTPSGGMWASMNGRDNLKDASGLPDTLPPEVIVFPVQSGGFYGWPYCYNPARRIQCEGHCPSAGRSIRAGTPARAGLRPGRPGPLH